MPDDAGLVPYDLEPGPRQLNPFDLLAPVSLLVPQYRPLVNGFTPEGRAELARRRADGRAQADRARELLAAARTEWEAARDRLAGNAAALAVLGIHQPAEGYARPVCGHCREPYYDDTEPVTWACPTYLAVTEA